MPFLDWVNKNQAKVSTDEVPYHLLQQVKAYGEPSENLVIQGDNLLALKALLPFYAGQVKCIFIDPPYNTQSAFEHYDDKLEHSQWLSMMYPRLVLLRELLAEDGSIWVTIDDNEIHYLKVLMDEVFGRSNFVSNVIWQKKFSPQNDAKWISNSHDHVICFAKNKNLWFPNPLPRTEAMDDRYKNPDNDPRGPWAATDLTRAEHRDRDYWGLVTPSGKTVFPAKGRSWSRPKENIEKLMADDRLWFGPTGGNLPRLKKFLSEMDGGVTPQSIWLHTEVGNNQEAKKEILQFDTETVFDTPKPERLIHRVIYLATGPSDIVLDSFLGSGTTAAVAHKMGRRYIGVEMGEHAKTHCIPRLEKVIDGEQGGISDAVGWKGGGGFRFCELGNPAFDAEGHINPGIKFPTLAAFVWHFETGAPAKQVFETPFLGVKDGVAYYLLYNGILGDRRPAGGNVLTHPVLGILDEYFPHDGPKVIYGETSRIGESRLAAEQITFRQIPYDIKVR